MKSKKQKTWKRVDPVVAKRTKPLRYIDAALPGFEAFSSQPIVDRLKEAVRPVMAQVAPGLYAPMRRGGSSPDNCLCFWADKGDGTYYLIPQNQRMVRLDAELAELLGFRGQYQTIRRLGVAGFVEVIAIAPHTYFINLDSWFNHMRRCAEDREFWKPEKKNLKAYRSVICRGME